MIGCLRTCVRKQPIIALYFKSERYSSFITSRPGARVVGCYAHVVPVLWYLDFEWYQPAIKSAKAHDTCMDYLKNAAAEVLKSMKDASDKSDIWKIENHEKT